MGQKDPPVQVQSTIKTAQVSTPTPKTWQARDQIQTMI